MIMERTAYVTLHVLFSVSAKELGLNENCSKQEFEKAATEYAREQATDIEIKTECDVNDIEIEVY